MGLAASSEPRPVFYFIGDSITEQASDPSKSGFITLLQQQYVRSVDMINRGLSGYNTNQVFGWAFANRSGCCNSHRWRLEEQAAWSWDDMMKRMEDLEAREAAGEGAKDEEEESTEAQAAALKAKGNDAFSRRWFQASNQYYSQAIELDPT
ncbi:hypothetical protein PF005_g25332, partial [Phytophthora fragariae]